MQPGAGFTSAVPEACRQVGTALLNMPVAMFDWLQQLSCCCQRSSVTSSLLCLRLCWSKTAFSSANFLLPFVDPALDTGHVKEHLNLAGTP